MVPAAWPFSRPAAYSGIIRDIYEASVPLLSILLNILLEECSSLSRQTIDVSIQVDVGTRQ